tara:strand:+ start:1002 stop:1736 length:735 start_codon:yes stop_codon:yes gene_type:complete
VIRFLRVLVILGLLTGCNKRLIHLNQDDIEVNAFKFDYFTAKAKLNYTDGDQKLSAVANLRIKYDSLIWISISPGLGIEVLRLKLTTDSVFLIDRIAQNYTKSSYREFNHFYGINLNFKWIQAIMMGNPLSSNKKLVVNKENGGILYEQNDGPFFIRNFIGDQSNKIEKISIRNSAAKYEMVINYGDFTQLNERAILPFYMKFVLTFFEDQQPPKQVNINIKSANLPDKTLKFPFNVPAKFLKD